MNKNDLNELVTKQDLEQFKVELKDILNSKLNLTKEFYTPKEFGYKTGIPYSSVIYKLNNGKIKGFQDASNCSWLIYSSELERFKDLANENLDEIS
jgi:hypothetical protein